MIANKTKNQDFTTTVLVNKTPAEAFNTIRNVRAWWSGLFDETFEGSSENLGDELSFRAGDGVHYSKHKLVELVPDKKLVWLVTEANLSFVDTHDEWKGTMISFEIFEEDGNTKIVFRHIGLVPEFECYDACSAAWSRYMQEKLKVLLTK